MERAQLLLHNRKRRPVLVVVGALKRALPRRFSASGSRRLSFAPPWRPRLSVSLVMQARLTESEQGDTIMQLDAAQGP